MADRRPCPRCGMGYDTDGDGDCALCGGTVAMDPNKLEQLRRRAACISMGVADRGDLCRQAHAAAELIAEVDRLRKLVRGENMPEANRETVEQLAALEHEQWAHWTRHVLHVMAPALVALEMSGDLADDVDGAVARWRRQIETPYEQLPETEKGSDREWARKALACLMSSAPSSGLTMERLNEIRYDITQAFDPPSDATEEDNRQAWERCAEASVELLGELGRQSLRAQHLREVLGHLWVAVDEACTGVLDESTLRDLRAAKTRTLQVLTTMGEL